MKILQSKWRKLNGWPYLVNEQGEIKSLVTGRIMKSRQSLNGYLNLTLSNNKLKKQVTVHSIVLLAFKGVRKLGMVARHLNGKKQDNRAENLSWGTQSENYKDRIKHGKSLDGTSHHMSKLSEKDVLYIRKNYEIYGYNKTNSYKLSKKFGVTTNAINDVFRGKTFKYLNAKEAREAILKN